MLPPTFSSSGGILSASTHGHGGMEFSGRATGYTLVASSSINKSSDGYCLIQQHRTQFLATVSGLVPNTTYFLFVNACASGSCSIYTALGSTITLANTPGLPSAFNNVSPVSLIVSFGANNNPQGTSYTIQISTDPVFASIVNSSITFLPSAVFTDLGSGHHLLLAGLGDELRRHIVCLYESGIDGDRCC